jgi:Tol biopolymer transport system component
VFICGKILIASAQGPAALARPEEKRLRNVRQLTFGGENAEAYFAADGKRLIFQSTRDGYPGDQIYTMALDGSDLRKVSTGKGRCTCSYFFPDGRRILYASTHLAGDAPPPAPDRSRGYVWALYPGYEIFSARPDGTDLKRLTENPGYDAEATISPRGDRILFTSLREGDLDLYVMDRNGKKLRRLTRALGYDGGAFFSPDGKSIVFRAHRPRTEAEIRDYRALLAENVIRPTNLEIYVIDADGQNERQVTKNGAANFCPFFTPDGKRIIFASNLDDPRGRNFDLYLVNRDGTGLERVTTEPTFDGFPMFSPDGKKLVWASNRNARQPGETNIFIADWVEVAPVQSLR